MQVQLNEAELEVAVTLYLSSQGMNLKNKELSFSFEGECSMDIEAITDEAQAPKPKQTRKKAAPKKEEPVKAPEVTPEPVQEEEPKIAVEEVVEALEEQTRELEVLDPEELFPTPKVTETKPNNENSIFA